MNTMGKLLVIVNLLFALATGAFLAVDFMARTKWRMAAEERADELAVMKANAQADHETKMKLVAELRSSKAELEELQINYQGTKGRLEVEKEQHKKDLNKQKDLTQLAILNVEKANKETERLQQEVVFLADLVKQREKEIATAQAAAATYSQRATQMLTEKNSALARAQNLFQQLKEKEILLAKALNASTGGGNVAMVPKVRDANFQNPPPVNIKGLIQHIDKVDRTLVQISLGSDAGLAKDHTMEVYRLQPQPEYLGRLRVLEVYPHLAVGRVVRPANMPNASPLQDGDQVATKLSP